MNLLAYEKKSWPRGLSGGKNHGPVVWVGEKSLAPLFEWVKIVQAPLFEWVKQILAPLFPAGPHHALNFACSSEGGWIHHRSKGRNILHNTATPPIIVTIFSQNFRQPNFWDPPFFRGFLEHLIFAQNLRSGNPFYPFYRVSSDPTFFIFLRKFMLLKISLRRG